MRHLPRSALLALAATLLLCLPALRGEFLGFDDELLVLDNPKVHGLSVANIKAAFTTFDPELYVPLTLLTYQVEWLLVGDDPLLYHVTNLLLHLASTLFVFLIARVFFTDRVSALCAVLFSLHPVQVEAVAWISGRKDLLASMFFLASTYTYLHWKREGTGKFLSVLLFALGLLAKVSIFPLPLALLLLDYLSEKRVTKQDIIEKWPYAVLSIVFLAVALLGKQTQVVTEPQHLLLLSFASVPLSLLHSVYPVGLTIFYPFIDPVSVSHPQIAGGMLVLLILAGLSVFVRKKFHVALFALLWFIVLLAPSLLNMFKGGELGVPDIYLTSDRYVYLAILGPVLLLGFLISRYERRWWAVLPVLGIFGVLTLIQIHTWHDSTALFRRVVDTGQPAHVAYTNLGSYVAQAGDLQEAEALYEQSLAIRNTSRGLYNLVQIKGKLGKKDEARALYNEYVKLRPKEYDKHALLRKFFE